MLEILKQKITPIKGRILKKEYQQIHNRLITTVSSENSDWNTTLIPCLESNYAFILWNKKIKQAVVVDVPDSNVIDAFLLQNELVLGHIWITHHHHDHIGGLKDLLSRASSRKNKPMIFYPMGEADKVEPLIDNYMLKAPLKGQDTFNLPASPLAKVTVVDVSGHTKGHIAYFIQEKKQDCNPVNFAFVGDALFSLGCGYLFDGMAQQMKESFDRLMALPDNTQIFCSHEYTQRNGKFAVSIDPDNLELRLRLNEVERLVSEGKPSVPTVLYTEKQTNPFLRLTDTRIRQNLGITPQTSDTDVFRIMRQAKDKF